FSFWKATKNGDRRLFDWLITFHIVCLAWIFFRAQNFEYAWLMLKQIFGPLPEIPVEEVLFAHRRIIGLLLLAFGLHFIPNSWVNASMRIYARSSLLLQALYVSFTIWLVIQVAQADVQPFIYFQF
ncbi:MAG: MBOAT family protein, partial [Bacteroidota bacterium]|nr:MBOAT family protein [Bacteroidota bacterium]MDX5431246.1 MBOAT family protein [Bacteroidota bacterium]MDX5469985.1 MBOAT family protein [Bacteroidota bacterium]